MSLHLVTRAIIRPLLDAGRRVLLLVLDGADAGTLVELLDHLPPTIGLRRPADLTGDATPAAIRKACDTLAGVIPEGIIATLSPLPTLTANGRRALFAGELPHNTALTESEAEAADATTDRHAWRDNPALAGHHPLLLLKGDLADDARALLDRLDDRPPRALAAVFNGVDDALSSKQTTAMGPWTPAAIHPALPTLIEAAIHAGWLIVLTADHGPALHRRHPPPPRPRPRPAHRPRPTADTVRFGPTPLAPAPAPPPHRHRHLARHPTPRLPRRREPRRSHRPRHAPRRRHPRRRPTPAPIAGWPWSRPKPPTPPPPTNAPRPD
ncbi:MAG: hypothetical protein R3F65_25575 [bacterium]